MYHYSPKTNKPEVCRASSRDTCPYSDCPHSEDFNTIQRYADKENELLSKLPKGQDKYFSEDQMSYTGIPYVLSTGKKNGFPELEITNDTYRYLGFTNSQIEEFSGYDKVYIIPQNFRHIQKFLQDNEALNICYKDLKEGFDDRMYGKGEGKPYDKWDAIPYLDYSKTDNGINIMDRTIRTKDPYGNNSYTLTSMWNDYLSLKEKKSEVHFSKKNKNRFFVICGNFNTEDK